MVVVVALVAPLLLTPLTRLRRTIPPMRNSPAAGTRLWLAAVWSFTTNSNEERQCRPLLPLLCRPTPVRALPRSRTRRDRR